MTRDDPIQTYYRNQCYAITGKKHHFETLQTNFNRLYKKYTEDGRCLEHCTEYFCAEPRTELMYGAAKLEEYLLACHSKEDRFLGHFLITSFQGLLQFWCYDDGNYTIRKYYCFSYSVIVYCKISRKIFYCDFRLLQC